MQGQYRFRPLVAVYARRHQTIEAASVLRVGKRDSSIVIAEEPPERSLRDVVPFGVPVCLKGGARRIDRGRRLDRLLVESQRRSIWPAEAMAANRSECPASAGLMLRQPAKRIHAEVDHLRLVQCHPNFKQSLGETGVVVSQLGLEPAPIVSRIMIVKLHELLTGLLDQPPRQLMVPPNNEQVAAHPARVGLCPE